MTLREDVRAAISNAYYGSRNAGRTMEHAADDATEAVLLLIDKARAEVAPLIRQALLDPGAFVGRGPDYDGNEYGERLDQWQDRAIQAVLDQKKEK